MGLPNFRVFARKIRPSELMPDPCTGGLFSILRSDFLDAVERASLKRLADRRGSSSREEKEEKEQQQKSQQQQANLLSSCGIITRDDLPPEIASGLNSDDRFSHAVLMQGVKKWVNSRCSRVQPGWQTLVGIVDEWFESPTLLAGLNRADKNAFRSE